ncbi:hypothetical protein SUGI_0933820 [Cryptomeria japonica]|nr:hypothetical protein SUGI_0933820 [Cryptomeria japonica]
MARQRSSKLMECLACPLSKESLRFCAKSNTLINDSMGVSYPVIDGIPHLVPTSGQLLSTQDSSENRSSSEVNNIEKGVSSTEVAWHKKD